MLDMFSDEELAVLKKVLLSNELQNIIGGGEWDLTDAEETLLWVIIKRLEVIPNGQ